MSDSAFVDTNILVYAHDSEAGRKYTVAAKLLESLWSSRTGIVSTQVLQEFYVNITAKIPRPIQKAVAARYVQRYFVWPVIRVSPATIERAFEVEVGNNLSFWDALIVSAAFQAGVKKIYSEDLNAGQRIVGITVVNPFA